MAFSPKRKSRQPERVGSLLRTFLDEKAPRTVSEEGRVFGAWAKAVGADVSRHANPFSFRNGILFVQTRHPVWTTELTSKRHVILKKLNAAVGTELVKEIHFRLAKS